MNGTTEDTEDTERLLGETVRITISLDRLRAANREKLAEIMQWQSSATGSLFNTSIFFLCFPCLLW
ncbi:hypothetical protein CSA56_09500 [candidate division KSB3 bacterium]|uniref:Uncharacterized protein n=1 Tax=candidate division KSB3 bacterium TaxID=2044937 RepID=A0A2G6KE04_9BACT|nr:MAG: hypothetical protein CSA56_09500 [candidate division KSB3 bacterium]